MIVFHAPAKVNFSLVVSPPRPDGYHPIESLAQTIEWLDALEVSPGEGRDSLEVDDPDLDPEDNLVTRALIALRRSVTVPPLEMSLRKQIPMAAGLGGGSSDAAAALLAGSEVAGRGVDLARETAQEVGADVALFLDGGTQMMTGVGEILERVRGAEGFALAVVVPDFGLTTADVYRRWDEMEGPTGDVLADREAPPALRGGIPLRNDLLPAALSLEPRLGDFIAEVSGVWGVPVCLTGSGSACFGYFPNLDEASSAAAAVADSASAARGVTLRPVGVTREDPPQEE